jgi:GT2 family glycosyltransferase
LNQTAVVILNYNGETFLRQFLPAVIQHSAGAEIIVADNSSTDSSLTVLSEIFPSVRVIKLNENYGFCEGYNRALKQVDTDYYVLLNSDVEVTENWLKPLIDLLNTHPHVAAVQPKIKSYHQKSLFEYAGAAGGFIDSLGYPFCRGRLFEEVEEDNNQYNDTREIFWASGACIAVRSSLYHQASGFDEDFFAHMEEIDLCWRLKRMNYSVYYSGESTVYHVGGGTLSAVNPKKTLLNFRNGLYLLLKNLPMAELLWKIPVRMMLDYLAAFKFLLDSKAPHAYAIFQAHYQVFKNLPTFLSKRKRFVKSDGTTRKSVGIFRGSIVWEYYIDRKKKIEI